MVESPLLSLFLLVIVVSCESVSDLSCKFRYQDTLAHIRGRDYLVLWCVSPLLLSSCRKGVIYYTIPRHRVHWIMFHRKDEYTREYPIPEDIGLSYHYRPHWKKYGGCSIPENETQVVGKFLKRITKC